MKKLLPLLPIAGLLTYLSMGSNSSGFPSVPGASSSGGCSCHGSNSASTVLSLTSTIPAGGWTAGATYTMTATVTNAARVAGGFDITVPSINGGTISNPSANTTLNGTTGIHHTAPKNFVSGSASWTFSWTAPTSAAATAVTFNMAGNAVNLSGTDQGDIPNLGTFTFQKATTTTPPATPTVSASGSTTICSGQSFPQLTASSSGATSYTWFSGATQVGTGASFTPTTAGTYTATATNTAGTSSASTPVTVTVNPSPALTATHSDITLCPGGCDTISLTSTVANTSYTFSVAGGGSGNATGNQIVFCLAPPPNNPTTPQVMTITGTAAGTACQGTTTQTIVANTPPSAAFTHTHTGLTYNFSGPTSTGLTYNWSFGNSQTSTVATPSVTYTTAGAYTVTLTTTNTQTGCTATTTQTVQAAATSVGALVGLEGFRFGPNPALRTLTLHTGGLKADVRLLDLTGTVISTLRTRNEVSIEKTVSLGNLSAGLYFLEVTTKDARGVEKLIVR